MEQARKHERQEKQESKNKRSKRASTREARAGVYAEGGFTREKLESVLGELVNLDWTY